MSVPQQRPYIFQIFHSLLIKSYFVLPNKNDIHSFNPKRRCSIHLRAAQNEDIHFSFLAEVAK
jgi:hypothetical protein